MISQTGARLAIARRLQFHLSREAWRQHIIRPHPGAPVRRVRAENSFRTNPIRLLISAISLILIAGLWVGIILDQWPCFLGVPNCD